MPRHRSAAALLGLALATAPTLVSAQTGQMGYAMGVPVEVDNPDGGNNIYVTPFAQTPEETFQAVQVVYGTLKIPTTTIIPDDHILGTTNWNVPHRLAGRELSRYFDCGSGRGQSADEETVHLTIRSTVKWDSSGHTTLNTYLTALGNSNIEMASKQFPCQSTGQLETRISDEVAKLLGTKAAKP